MLFNANFVRERPAQRDVTHRDPGGTLCGTIALDISNVVG